MKKRIEEIKSLRDTQRIVMGHICTAYDKGKYDGLELAIATLEGKRPELFEKRKKRMKRVYGTIAALSLMAMICCAESIVEISVLAGFAFAAAMIGLFAFSLNRLGWVITR